MLNTEKTFRRNGGMDGQYHWPSHELTHPRQFGFSPKIPAQFFHVMPLARADFARLFTLGVGIFLSNLKVAINVSVF